MTTRRRFARALLLGLLAIGGAGLRAARAQDSGQEPVFGRQLMTQEEMLRYRERLRSAGSEQERQRIRAEHHAQMQERARERGVTLPDTPPMRGGGMGMGGGQGGMGGMPPMGRQGGGGAGRGGG